MDRIRRSPAGIRAARQGRDQPCIRSMTHQGGFPSGDVTKADLDRPHADARRGLRLLARLDPGHAAAVPPARGAFDPGHGHRGRHRPGLSRGHPQRRCWRPWVWPARVFVGVPAKSKGAAPTLMRPSRRDKLRPSSRPPGLPSGGRLRHGSRHGGLLSDAARPWADRECTAVVAAAGSPMSRAATQENRGDDAMGGFRCIAASARMSVATATASAASARSVRRRPSGMAAPGPPTPGRTRRAGSLSPMSRTSWCPTRGHTARLDRVANLVHAAID